MNWMAYLATVNPLKPDGTEFLSYTHSNPQQNYKLPSELHALRKKAFPKIGHNLLS